MERQSLVQDVEVRHEGQTYRASYFVEGSTIHAKIGGRTRLSPVGAVWRYGQNAALRVPAAANPGSRQCVDVGEQLMALSYWVVDLRTDVIDAMDIIIEGVTSPEEAARKALDIDVVRSGATKDLAARVYWQTTGQPMTMVRLYRKLDAGNRLDDTYSTSGLFLNSDVRLLAPEDRCVAGAFLCARRRSGFACRRLGSGHGIAGLLPRYWLD